LGKSDPVKVLFARVGLGLGLGEGDADGESVGELESVGLGEAWAGDGVCGGRADASPAVCGVTL
jgi:hypothetical protein